ncbi:MULTISPECIES: hypothetical protein [Terrabacteria group]|uniref:hypothetical protein n=1 Tax=Bacillati TaxID=1783272 RepID=UPI0036256EBA
MFESSREYADTEVWAALTLHCPDDKPEVWVLWDPSVKTPKPSSWLTIVPGRSPVRKAHTKLGYAQSAIRSRIYGPNGSHSEMTLWEMDPATGEYVLLHTIPQGTHEHQLPW